MAERKCTECETKVKSRDGNTCYYCGLNSKRVEAGGMWHCPNLLCTGPGAVWFREKLESYKDDGDGRHSVDNDEWKYQAKKYLKDHPDEGYCYIEWKD